MDSACPAGLDQAFDVYGRPLGRGGEGAGEVRESNMMPDERGEEPIPGQRKSLSRDRERSSIPKAGTGGERWVYPSEQMFFSALARKGKADGVREEDMAGVVAAHNRLNEQAWREVLKYEQLPPHGRECPHPMLRRFQGRPDKTSPLALARRFAGQGLPFDRHDWYVLRCQREVRYVIDFYHEEGHGGSPGTFRVVARPALDSPEAAMDRLKLSVHSLSRSLGLPCPVTGSRPHPDTSSH